MSTGSSSTTTRTGTGKVTRFFRRSALSFAGASSAARYGGEELVMLLPDTVEAAAEIVAEAIRLQVAALNIPHANTDYGIVTISGGVATFIPNAQATADDLVRRCCALSGQVQWPKPYYRKFDQTRTSPLSAIAPGGVKDRFITPVRRTCQPCWETAISRS